MTEEEAKTKWCPFASSRLLVWQKSQGVQVNKFYSDNTGEPHVNCLASDCMAWRCGEKNSAESYCGLAGKP